MGPRTLDLDILFYDDLVLTERDLFVPHPDMKNRKFVLEPLSELAPFLVHPVYRKTLTNERLDFYNIYDNVIFYQTSGTDTPACGCRLSRCSLI